MRRTVLAVALGMGLMSALCACGNRESEGNTMKMIGAESAEANIGNQSVRNSGQIDQTEQEAAMAAGYERSMWIRKEWIYMELFIFPPGQKERGPQSLCPMNWVRLWTG